MGNKKISKKRSRISTHACHFAMVMLACFAMTGLNMAASSKCNQLMKQLDGKSRELKRLEAELDRATAAWDAVRSPDSLDRALVRWGISMQAPGANQIVRMDAGGRPHPGQTSVAMLRRRAQGALSAVVSASGVTAASVARGARRR